MQDRNLKNAPDFFKEEKLLLKLLLYYCIGVTVCRVFGPYMRYIAYIDWLIYRKDFFVRLPYYLVPIAAVFWLRWRRSRAGLMFTAGVGVTGILNHAYSAFISLRSALPFFRVRMSDPPVRVNVLTATALAVIFAGMSLYIFLLSKKLYAIKEKNHDGKIPYPLKACCAFLLLLFCHIAPFMEYEGIADFIARLFGPSYELVEVHNAGSRIRYMTGSPDGKLLAIGANDGLYVWDAASQQCVWSDDILRKVHRVRFSPSGKYLAAGGRGVPEGSSDIAVYEVDGFKKLPGVEMLEEDLTKEKIFYDIAFRPDEKSFLIAWHKDWDWKQIPGGYYGDEAKAIDKREAIITPQGMRRVVKDLICAELDAQSGQIKNLKTIKTLSMQYDLLLSGGIGFSPSASYLLYPHCYTRGNKIARNRLYVVDTHTWQEEKIMLDDKYSIYTGVGLHRDGDWYEWKFTKDEKDIYLLAEEEDINGIGRGMNMIAHSLLKLNMETKKTQEIFREPGGRTVWLRIALSPDDTHLVLRGFGPEFRKIRDKKQILRIVDLQTKEYEQLPFPFNAQGNVEWQYVWLNEDTVVVALYERDEFFFANIRKERKR